MHEKKLKLAEILHLTAMNDTISTEDILTQLDTSAKEATILLDELVTNGQLTSTSEDTYQLP